MMWRDRLAVIFRAVAFVLIALGFCGVIFEMAGYSVPFLFYSIAEGARSRPPLPWNNLPACRRCWWYLPCCLRAHSVARCGRPGRDT